MLTWLKQNIKKENTQPIKIERNEKRPTLMAPSSELALGDPSNRQQTKPVFHFVSLSFSDDGGGGGGAKSDEGSMSMVFFQSSVYDLTYTHHSKVTQTFRIFELASFVVSTIGRQCF